MTVHESSVPLGVPNQLTFIGGGHLAQALLTGISSCSSWAAQCRITLTTRRVERAEELRKRFPHVLVTLNNNDPGIWKSDSPDLDTRSGMGSHVLFICTRPADVRGICEELLDTLAAITQDLRPTVVTMCPGITVRQLQMWLPPGTAVVRTMPNTPVECRQGATGIFASADVGKYRVTMIKTALQDVSPSIALLEQEELLDVVAAISGSAPAHVYYLMEALIAVGESHGLAPDIARELVTQSCLGAGQLARDAGVPVGELRAGVCVPGGSTGKAIAHLEKKGFLKEVKEAVEKSLAANRQMQLLE
ncbi:pyrroline-5-carboxylate reductase dimerization-domain-containing protein [Aspergillus cavernicola]|uniref:Pyrroline-5-carboxylate reductase dimerization-domain-containing protein n=1 Tax=Aspergillus cavernicola TaxID=176166 RepID=A0ABR4HFZ4_9EURO